jgi:adenosylcobinamide-GDP ribazoletransferase
MKMTELKRFFTAVQFFTRLPIPFAAWVGYSPEQLNASSRYFPLVGWMIGALVCASIVLLCKVLPISVALLLGFAFSALLTGAFHEDGFTDAVDGLGGAYDRDKALAIMRDSRIGSFGALALFLLIAVKWQTLLSLSGTDQGRLMFITLFIAQPLSRWFACVLMKCLPYVELVSDAGAQAAGQIKAKPVAESISHFSFVVASLTGLIAPIGLIYLYAPGVLGPVLAGCALAAAISGYWAWRLKLRIGGITGDALGACQQLSEAAFYIGVLACLRW